MQIKRSNKPDLLLKFVFGLNILSWFIFIAALVMFHFARPEIEYGIVRYFGLSVRKAWLSNPKDILLFLLYTCSFISILAMVIGRVRNRRRHDAQRYNLFMLLLVCIGFILVMIL
ncbi:hypothetical protein CJF42_14645 [Pseudoalteromonas sp. NBT06-2]|uniref:hypothetical protein n=1 Tax=Pseudoalteromonas sp. NBT06-2 TaxID=2025950 RepID=UPI000BA64D8A|nr:hypothetical protein [Pseudoalteromonas sp. NBT06-2]PAJ73652.1 hypothetical protein CJF42_14645 [Pseudoalteromonas sp. NBT06-2]